MVTFGALTGVVEIGLPSAAIKETLFLIMPTEDEMDEAAFTSKLKPTYGAALMPCIKHSFS